MNFTRLTTDQAARIRAGYRRMIRLSRSRRLGFLRAQREAAAFLQRSAQVAR